jgi:CheY-like chemotaxis protein/two-component sensor histidine kinase
VSNASHDGRADLLRRVADLERKLADAEAALGQFERADRAKDHFISVLSHDLRAPIHAVLGWAQMLRQGLLPDGARERAVLIIERNARAQLRLVEELLDVTRIASDKLALELAPVDLGGLALRVVENLKATQAGRSLVVELEPYADLHVSGDGGRLEQVITNLVSNALKFTPEGGCVRVGVSSDDELVVLRVQDDGAGIPSEILPTVFERFRQDLGSSSAGVGVGLGLYIVRQIVELHGGSVEAESAGEGRGATFVVRLPSVDAASAPRISSTHSLPDTESKLDGIDVLLVEDEADTRELMTAILIQAGATVRSAGDVQAALALFEERIPDALVSDIGLPGDDGCVLVQRLRLRAPGLPAVALSGFAGRPHVEDAISAGFDLHFAKPIEGARLVAALVELTRDLDLEV